MSNADSRLLAALVHGYHLVDTGSSLVLRKGHHQRGVRIETLRAFGDRLRQRLESLAREAAHA